MLALKKTLPFRISNFISLSAIAFAAIIFFWLSAIGLSQLGLSFPQIKIEKFFDLGFFSVSAFGLITFLTMISFQTVEGKLSPGFLARILKSTAAHFGLYVLMFSSIICFFIINLKQIPLVEMYSNQLFIALITTIVFSIISHRIWVLRCLYHPYVVYNYIKELKWEEPVEQTWMELFECTYKAIREGRVSDSLNFLDLISYVFEGESKKEKNMILYEDLQQLYTSAQGCRPIARFMEKKWIFLTYQSTPIIK